jgi:hypothetical protein
MSIKSPKSPQEATVIIVGEQSSSAIVSALDNVMTPFSALDQIIKYSNDQAQEPPRTKVTNQKLLSVPSVTSPSRKSTRHAVPTTAARASVDDQYLSDRKFVKGWPLGKAGPR